MIILFIESKYDPTTLEHPFPMGPVGDQNLSWLFDQVLVVCMFD